MTGSSPGVGLGVGVASGVGIGVAVGTRVAVGAGVSVAVGIGVEVRSGIGVADAVGTRVAVGTGVSVAVGIGVEVRSGVGVADAVAIGALVGTSVGVRVGVVDAVAVGNTATGVAAGAGAHAANNMLRHTALALLESRGFIFSDPIHLKKPHPSRYTTNFGNVVLNLLGTCHHKLPLFPDHPPPGLVLDLDLVQAPVEPIAGHQLLVRPHLDNLATFQDDDDICTADRGQAMRDDNGRPAHQQAFQCLLDQ